MKASREKESNAVSGDSSNASTDASNGSTDASKEAFRREVTLKLNEKLKPFRSKPDKTDGIRPASGKGI